MKSIPARVVVTEVVREKELIALKRLEEEENESAAQFETAIIQGLLGVVDFESESEEEAFVNYAFELGDDGESATCAIAIQRGWAIATEIELRTVLDSIRTKGRYIPSRNHPLLSWWQTSMQ
ncbi:hypothetical protein [Synechococcus sp. PCC 7336]|uniref:hypothetical protein n=1 Tax=Synechococcus sp. PCC 7336 TaxID=195250 RepID=UPI001D0CE3F1|nr:hypothetical protein [Synechococcus sp. PCC 7336]